MDSRHRAYNDECNWLRDDDENKHAFYHWLATVLRFRCNLCFAGLQRILGRLLTAYWYSLLLVLLFSEIIVEMTVETTFGAVVFYGAVKRPVDFYARLRWNIVID